MSRRSRWRGSSPERPVNRVVALVSLDHVITFVTANDVITLLTTDLVVARSTYDHVTGDSQSSLDVATMVAGSPPHVSVLGATWTE
jgi:hypothetical protein